MYSPRLHKSLNYLIRRKEFWIAIVLLIIAGLLFDFVFLSFWSIREIFFTRRDPLLFGLILADIIIDVYEKRASFANKRFLKSLGRVLFIFILIWGFIDYGFFQTLYLATGVFIISRLSRFLIGRYFKPSFVKI